MNKIDVFGAPNPQNWEVKQQDSRLAPEYFPPFDFVKDPFENDESVFFHKNSASNFLIFPNLKMFWLLRWKTHFKEISFDTHSAANLPRLPRWKNSSIFSKQPIYFFQKTQFLNVERSYCCSCIQLQVCYNLMTENKFRVWALSGQLASKR